MQNGSLPHLPKQDGAAAVPLFSTIQADAAKDRRARIAGGVNIFNAAFIVLGCSRPPCCKAGRSA
jgi:hypothetical protein